MAVLTFRSWIADHHGKAVAVLLITFAQLVASAAVADLPATAPSSNLEAKLSTFTVYDGTLLRGKPSKIQPLAGLAKVVILYEWAPLETGLFQEGDKEGIPSKGRFTRLLRSVKSGTPVVLDIERWYTDSFSEASWMLTYAKLTQTVRNFKAARPDLPVAAFDAIPFGYNAVIHGDAADINRVRMQVRILSQPGGLNELVDFHTAGASAAKTVSSADWEKWIRWRTRELESLRRPIHWMITPYYNGTKELIPPDQWNRQLAVVKEIAQSVIVWTDYIPAFMPTDHWYRSLRPK